MKTYVSGHAILLALVLCLLVAGIVFAQDVGVVAFTNLPEGSTVTQLTTLTGTIAFPDFLKYEIFLKNGGGTIWVANGFSPVKDGNLARLEPRVLASGSYQVIVRQVHSDSNYLDVTGPTITIHNPNQTPLLYYPEVPPSFLYASNGLAVVRAENCAGEEFFFDYTSPQNGRSSGQVKLPGRTDTLICPFTDLQLIPGDYRGTAKGGAQLSGNPLNLLAEAGKVYRIGYYGPGAGADQLTVVEIKPDTMISTEGQPTAVVAATVPPTVAATAVSTPTVATATPQPVLPVSGNDPGASTNFSLPAMVLIAALLGGGIFAMRRKRHPAA